MITIDKYEKKYKGFKLNISMEIPDGQVTGLVGKNGAGKSTTIKAILGLIKPDGGAAYFDGVDSQTLGKKEKANIGVALSDSGFSLYLTVDSIMKVMKKMYSDFDENTFKKLCEEYGLPLKKPLKTFSTGMKARLKVLLALSHNAKFLILDEPTAGLDVEARNEILDMIRDYLAEDETRSMLITSHISSDLESLCDDIYLIHDGEVKLHEDTDTILSQYAVLKVKDEDFEKLDKAYLIEIKKETFGYTCFTNEKQYYVENYPGIVVENGKLDDLILMMTGRR